MLFVISLPLLVFFWAIGGVFMPRDLAPEECGASASFMLAPIVGAALWTGATAPIWALSGNMPRLVWLFVGSSFGFISSRRRRLALPRDPITIACAASVLALAYLSCSEIAISDAEAELISSSASRGPFVIASELSVLTKANGYMTGAVVTAAVSEALMLAACGAASRVSGKRWAAPIALAACAAVGAPMMLAREMPHAFAASSLVLGAVSCARAVRSEDDRAACALRTVIFAASAAFVII